MRPGLFLIGMSFVLGLGACANNTRQAAPPAIPPQATALQLEPAAQTPSKHQGGWISITPFTRLTRYDCADTPPAKGAGTCTPPFDDRFSGVYTRLIVYGDIAGDSQDRAADEAVPFPYKTRDWLPRLFVGVHSAITLVAKVSAGAFSATVPLVTVEHISNKTSGESFNRIIYHRAENYPLFLVRKDGSDSIVSAQIVVKASDQYQSDAAGIALRLIQNVAKFVAPTAPVITTLTAQNTKNVATAIDQSVNQLFQTQIDEEQWVDDDIRQWGTRVSFTFNIPKDEGSWTDTPDQTVGKWTIAFANPRPSIFSDFSICPPPPAGSTATPKRCAATFAEAAKVVEAEVTADQVLSFHLVGNQPNLDTIQKYLMQQDWYQKDVTAMAVADANSGPFKDTVSSFCRAIKNTIGGLGLNGTDAGIVVVAVQKGSDLPAKIVTAMGKNQADCGYQ